MKRVHSEILWRLFHNDLLEDFFILSWTSSRRLILNCTAVDTQNVDVRVPLEAQFMEVACRETDAGTISTYVPEITLRTLKSIACTFRPKMYKQTDSKKNAWSTQTGTYVCWVFEGKIFPLPPPVDWNLTTRYVAALKWRAARNAYPAPHPQPCWRVRSTGHNGCSVAPSGQVGTFGCTWQMRMPSGLQSRSCQYLKAMNKQEL